MWGRSETAIILKLCITLPSPTPQPAQVKPTPSAASSQGKAMVLHGTFWRVPRDLWPSVVFCLFLHLSPFSSLHTLYSSRTWSWINNVPIKPSEPRPEVRNVYVGQIWLIKGAVTLLSSGKIIQLKYSCELSEFKRFKAFVHMCKNVLCFIY